MFHVERATKASVRDVLVRNADRKSTHMTGESNLYPITGQEFADHASDWQRHDRRSQGPLSAAQEPRVDERTAISPDRGAGAHDQLLAPGADSMGEASDLARRVGRHRQTFKNTDDTQAF